MFNKIGQIINIISVAITVFSFAMYGFAQRRFNKCLNSIQKINFAFVEDQKKKTEKIARANGESDRRWAEIEMERGQKIARIENEPDLLIKMQLLESEEN